MSSGEQGKGNVSPDHDDSSVRKPSGPTLGVPGPGSVIAGKYEVERVLGSGGMGIVLAARRKQLGQRVAIKLLHGGAAADSSAATRFLRERAQRSPSRASTSPACWMLVSSKAALLSWSWSTWRG
jgi:serine/threonine protein kinase